ncbi:MAG: hypothetical protein QOG11_565, partial [Solirubrobacteraceae bacterium]|nr:hypothetical protein [Solirubrobacteraceae bacterium]
TAAQAEQVCDAIATTRALDRSRARAFELVAEAKADLPTSLPDGQRHALDLIADGVVSRYA